VNDNIDWHSPTIECVYETYEYPSETYEYPSETYDQHNPM